MRWGRSGIKLKPDPGADEGGNVGTGFHEVVHEVGTRWNQLKPWERGGIQTLVFTKHLVIGTHKAATS
jgi:hypothetical protein